MTPSRSPLALAFLIGASLPALAGYWEPPVKRKAPPIQPPSLKTPTQPSKPTAPTTPVMPTFQAWMSTDLQDAWAQGFKGQGTTVTVVDDFYASSISGNWGTGAKVQSHGLWTSSEIGLLAPSATIVKKDWSSTAVALGAGLNTINMSYGMYAAAGYNVSQIGWAATESSIRSYAANGQAVVVKAAGNDAVAVNSANRSGKVDYLNAYLTGTKATIFVGALDRNGTTSNKANLASYSNYAGSNVAVQNQFLVAGVAGNLTGLYGTSFAAPVVAGYSAILGSKFSSATPTQIVNQLLVTARKDTINNYNAAVHGRGEASLSRALAPASIK